MNIKIVEAKARPKKRTPEQLAKGHNTVFVELKTPITIEIDDMTVTFPAGVTATPAEVANYLFAQGAEVLRPDGTYMKRDAPKPAPMRYPDPFGGTMRWKL
jgi:hypothetical protein